jgi:hypothetical protein
MKGGMKSEMANLKDTAKAYEPKKTKNIADLEVVNIETVQTEERMGKNDEGKIEEIAKMQEKLKQASILDGEDEEACSYQKQNGKDIDHGRSRIPRFPPLRSLYRIRLRSHLHG